MYRTLSEEIGGRGSRRAVHPPLPPQGSSPSVTKAQAKVELDRAQDQAQNIERPAT
jgi:hypothetical protein